MNTPKPTTGEIRPKSTPAKSPTVILIEAIQQDLATVQASSATGSTLCRLAGLAYHTVNLALIEADREAIEQNGLATGTEGKA